MLVGKVFICGLGDLVSILDRDIPMTQKIENAAALLNTQDYKLLFNGKVGEERSSALPYSL